MRQRPKPVKSKAKVPVAPKSPKDEDAKVRDLEKRLAEAQEREQATGEILRVISSSPKTCSRSSTRSCAARCGCATRDSPTYSAWRMTSSISPLTTTSPSRRSSISGAPSRSRCRKVAPSRPRRSQGTVVHIHESSPVGCGRSGRALTRSAGYRTVLAVPILREARRGSHRCRPKRCHRSALALLGQEVALLRTFADQAVIAIENVRLFTELQEKNRALTEAHAQVTNHWNSRQRRAKSSRSSAALRSTSSQCWTT